MFVLLLPLRTEEEKNLVLLDVVVVLNKIDRENKVDR